LRYEVVLTNIHIGTSGYSYKHWRGEFYPPGLRPGNYLPFYARHFRALELNASFYRLPDEKTVLGWMAQVPPDFIFCPKMSRYLTHMKKLRDPEEPLARFFGVFAQMQEQMGPILFQLPDRYHFKPEVAGHFYETFRKNYAQLSAVIEVRHPSWLSDESMKMMEEFAFGLVINNSGVHFPYSERITSNDVYIRFHGPGQLYASSYSEEDLAEYAQKMRHWASQGNRVWAFFNNDIHGYAPRDPETHTGCRNSLPGPNNAANGPACFFSHLQHGQSSGFNTTSDRYYCCFRQHMAAATQQT
jgi:uncharacterized protein YecE (DUF72 family)